MEEINGISFENWAAACGHLTQGMSEEEVCNVLEIEMPVWQGANKKWGEKLGVLMAEDMAIATKYGEIFANPKVGKFANVGSDVPSLEDILKIAPDFDTYKKIFWHQSKASQVGIDATSILKEYGLNLQNWGQLNMHYMNWHNQFMEEGKGTPVENERFHFIRKIEDKWQNHWDEFFANQKTDLADDIDF